MNNQIITSGNSPLTSTTIGSGDLVTVNAGAQSIDVIVDGGQETVFGVASATTVEQGGLLAISSLVTVGSASATTVSSGGTAVVYAGASATSTVVDNGGTFAVIGSATGVTVNSGGVALITASGTSVGSASAVEVNSGGILVAFSGADVTSTTVDNGGYLVALPGATIEPRQAGAVISSGVAVLQAGGTIATWSANANDLNLSSGAIEFVLSGGAAVSGTVASGASQQIYSGGSAIQAVLDDSIQTVNSGGFATATTLNQGAVEYVFSGGSAADTTVNVGYVIVNSGGSVTAVVVNSGGNVSVDGRSKDTVLNSGGGEYVNLDGKANGTQINSGAYAYVYGTASNSVIGKGGYEVIENGLGTAVNNGDGGLAFGETVQNGGVLLNYGPNGDGGSGGSTYFDTIESGGIEVVFAGALDSGTTVQSGGIYIALQGAQVSGLVVENGGMVVSQGIVQITQPGSVALLASLPQGTTLTSGMSDYVMASATITGVAVGNNARVEIDQGGTASNTVIQGGGTLNVAAGGHAVNAITFAGSGGVLDLNVPALPDAVISGFAAGDTINFDLLTGTIATASIAAGNTLVVSDGTTTESVRLDPGQDFSGVSLVAQGSTTGASVTIQAPATVGPMTGGVTQPVDIPLYVLPNGAGSYKIGIEVSLNGGSTYNMYEFDTGGTGFWAAYDPTNWSSYTTQGQAPSGALYASGVTYTGQVVSTDVTLQTMNGGSLTINNANVSLISFGENSKNDQPSPQGWNQDLTGTPSMPPLETNFYGDFGMSLATNSSGLSAVLSQIGGTLSNGFIITVGAYPDGTLGQVGSVQIGLTQADIQSFTTIISMQGQSTLNPHANSGQPSYSEVLAAGTLFLSNPTLGSYTNPDTGFVFDTGAPTMEIHSGTGMDMTTITDLINAGTTTLLRSTSPAAASPYDPMNLQFNVGTNSGQDMVNTSTVDVIGEPQGYVNTGLTSFFGYEVMYDLADGIMGFKALACFAAGTRIATPLGEVDVAALQPGDSVVTIDGVTETIKWVGHRRVDCRRHPVPQSVLPVRIQAHAFGPDQPRRDLYLSPDHAVYVEDALIPVRYLLNGTTVAQVRRDSVTYYHLELARHDVVLADGLPAETYLDTGQRSAFIDGGVVVQAHAEFSPKLTEACLLWEAKGYAPLTIAGAKVERARQRLLGRLASPTTKRPRHRR